MQALALLILLAFATICAAQSAGFYSNPNYRFYYSYHPYRGLRGIDRFSRDANFTAGLNADSLTISFRGGMFSICDMKYRFIYLITN